MKIGLMALKLVWAVMSDMVFGKYQFAEYLRRRKFTTVTILALIATAGAFFWMTEQSLIHAGLARHAQQELSKYNPSSISEIIRQSDAEHDLRIRLICKDSYSKYCDASKLPTKTALCQQSDPIETPIAPRTTSYR